MSGKQIRKSLETDNADEARHRAYEIWGEASYRVKNGLTATVRPFSTVAEEFISLVILESERNERGEYHPRDWPPVIRRYLVGFFGDKPIDTIREPDIERYMEWRRQYWVTGPGKYIKFIHYERDGKKLRRPAQHEIPSISRQRGELVVARALFRQSVKWGYPDHVPLLKNSQYDERAYPVKISIKDGLSIEQQAEAIAAQVQDQLVAYPEETIGIICPRNEDVAAIAKALSHLGLDDSITICKNAEFNPEAPVWLSTMSAAKGLEFRCVHIAGLEHLSKMGGVQKRLAYTAVTRAKTALSFYYENNIPAYLAGALNVVSPSTKAITRSRIFGKE